MKLVPVREFIGPMCVEDAVHFAEFLRDHNVVTSVQYDLGFEQRATVVIPERQVGRVQWLTLFMEMAA